VLLNDVLNCYFITLRDGKHQSYKY